MTYQELTKWAADAFERATREDGSHYYRIKNDLTPLSDEIDRDWLQDVVKDAHDGEMPSDWVYNQVDNCFKFLSEQESFDDAYDNMYENMSSDDYYGDLLNWIRENTTRAMYIEKVIEDNWVNTGKDFNFFEAIKNGQQEQIQDIYSSIIHDMNKVELEEA